jgi:hypothetical protein
MIQTETNFSSFLVSFFILFISYFFCAGRRRLNSTDAINNFFPLLRLTSCVGRRIFSICPNYISLVVELLFRFFKNEIKYQKRHFQDISFIFFLFPFYTDIIGHILRRHNFTTYTHTHTFKNHGKTVHFTILFFEDFLFFFKFFVLNF